MHCCKHRFRVEGAERHQVWPAAVAVAMVAGVVVVSAVAVAMVAITVIVNALAVIAAVLSAGIAVSAVMTDW